jgi:hypothetical protein
MAIKAVNKTKMALELGVSRASLYYRHKRPAIDEEVKSQIESVMADHPAYGHKRIAIQLAMGHNRIRRIMKKYNLKPYLRKASRIVKKKDLNKPYTGYPNLIKNICPLEAGVEADEDDFETFIKTGRDLKSKSSLAQRLIRVIEKNKQKATIK